MGQFTQQSSEGKASGNTTESGRHRAPSEFEQPSCARPMGELLHKRPLRFSASTFPKLKILDIDGLDNIENVTIWEGAMPQLEELSLNKCPSLQDNSFGLSGVQYLPSLKELLLKNCGEKQNLIDVLQGHVNRHSRRPKFLISKSRIVL